MKKLIVVLLTLSLSVYASAIVVRSSVLDLFDLRAEVNDSLRAESFAVWFNAVAADYPYTEHYMYRVGISLDSLLDQFDLEANKKGLDKLKREFDFYPEQQPKFKRKLNDYLKKHLANITAKVESYLATDAIQVIICRTSDPHEFLLGMRNSGEKKARIKTILIGTDNVLPIYPLVFYKSNGKPKKARLTEDFTFQRMGRTDDDMVSMKVIIGKESWTTSLSAIVQPKPFIRQFFSSEKNTIEGERIALTWEVLGAKDVFVNEGIGLKDRIWQLYMSPIDSTIFELSASNEAGTVTQRVEVNVQRILLAKAKITYFNPESGDPKAKGTLATVRLHDIDEKEVACFVGGDSLEYSSKTPYNGPFELLWPGIIYKRDLKKGFFTVEIESSLPDTWVFSPILILEFTDGTSEKLFGYGNRSISVGGEPTRFEF
jgi:hypothetical protein